MQTYSFECRQRVLSVWLVEYSVFLLERLGGITKDCKKMAKNLDDTLVSVVYEESEEDAINGSARISITFLTKNEHKLLECFETRLKYYGLKITGLISKPLSRYV